VAIIHLTGEIREGKGSDDLIGGGAAGSDAAIKAIRTAAKDDKVAAIVLRIDSPGGSAARQRPHLAGGGAGRQAGGREPSRYRRQRRVSSRWPLAADRIVAARGTLTGSIGVAGKIAVGRCSTEAGRAYGRVSSKGRNAGWLSCRRPSPDHEREAFMATMRDVYRALHVESLATGLPHRQREDEDAR